MSFGTIHSSWIKELTTTQMVLLAFIVGLTRKEGYCWATNKHLANLMEVDVRHIRLMISSLVEKGFINMDVPITAAGSRRYITLTAKAFPFTPTTTPDLSFESYQSDEGVGMDALGGGDKYPGRGLNLSSININIKSNIKNKNNILSTQNSKNEVEKGDVVENDLNSEMNKVNLPLETTVVYDEEKKPTPHVLRPPRPLKPSKALKNQQDIDEFNQFWAMYPRKTAKPAALKAWLSTKPDLTTVLNGLEKAKQRWVKDKTESRFIPHPSTWLNQERYNDEETSLDDQNDTKKDEWWLS